MTQCAHGVDPRPAAAAPAGGGAPAGAGSAPPSRTAKAVRRTPSGLAALRLAAASGPAAARTQR
eukprot:7472393-Lingulodinium_polyedra.AAC.1